MAENELVPFGTAVAADVLSACLIPGGSALQALVAAHLKKKQREAAELLIEEIRTGWHGGVEFAERDTDPLIEIILRFSKAVTEGTARENLRLLAQVIAGLKKNKALQPDKFQKWCGILEQLTRDELIVLGVAFRWRKKNPPDVEGYRNTFWQDVGEELKAGGYSDAEIGALCASLSRTGLLAPVSAYGGLIYFGTPWLDELGGLANLEGITS
jgi:hypothetical protein